MGAIFAKLCHPSEKTNLRILMLGLDGAGKTTLLYKLKVGEVKSSAPTVGFNIETVEYKNLSLTVWDLSGQAATRQIWYHYYPNTAAVIFVVDASDMSRINESKQELHEIMDQNELTKSVLLVFANKEDLPNCAHVHEISMRLYLHGLNQLWHIQACSATNGTGLEEGLEHLREMLQRNKEK